jgi:tight adherence protein C
MTVILIIALALFAFAVAMLLNGLIVSRGRAAGTLTRIGGYGFGGTTSDSDADSSEPLFSGIATRLGELAGARFGSLTELRRKLVIAGMYGTPARKFVGYQILLTILLPICWILLAQALGSSLFITVFGFIWALAFGWLVPQFYLSRKGRLRREQVDRDLPELVDLLVVTVEAGVGFTGSLRIAADRLRGPLGEELRLTLQEQNMGLSTGEALRNFGERCPTPGVRTFIRSIIQGETLGVSIGQIMRNIALEMRKRRRANAEERAQKAPVKMLFPLIFLIFPAMFVVLLVPAIITFIHALSSR